MMRVWTTSWMISSTEPTFIISIISIVIIIIIIIIVHAFCHAVWLRLAIIRYMA